MADIIEIAQSEGTFSTLISAAQAAGLVETLKDAGPFTIFAPTDEAFAALPTGTLDDLLKDTQRLKDILSYHVVAEDLTPADLLDRRFLPSLLGQRLTVDATLDAVEVDTLIGAPETMVVIDDVDFDDDDDDDDGTEAGGEGGSLTYSEDDDDNDDISDVVVVTVEDDDVEEIDVVTVLESIKINGANVTQAVEADNGMVYVIDAVLTPRAAQKAAAPAPASEQSTTTAATTQPGEQSTATTAPATQPEEQSTLPTSDGAAS